MKKFVLLLLIIFTASIFAYSQNTSAKIKNSQNEEFQSPFRYVIIDGVTELEKYVNRDSNEFLSLEVLLEDKAFTEENLKKLLELLSIRFNSVPVLQIHVYTSLDAIRTPEENDHINLKGPKDDYFKYKNALLWRNLKSEGFKYSIPNKVSGKTIILKEFK